LDPLPQPNLLHKTLLPWPPAPDILPPRARHRHITVIIGSVRKKKCYSFGEYLLGAIDKLGWTQRMQVSAEDFA